MIFIIVTAIGNHGTKSPDAVETQRSFAQNIRLAIGV